MDVGSRCKFKMDPGVRRDDGEITRHSRAGGNPATFAGAMQELRRWVPAFAGMTASQRLSSGTVALGSAGQRVRTTAASQRQNPHATSRKALATPTIHSM